MGSVVIPHIKLSTGRAMPAVGMGTAAYPIPPADEIRSAVLGAIALGYRHFDTAAIYSNEEPLGEALAEALRGGMVGSRDELFVTSKLWGTDAHPGHVIPAIRLSLQKLQLEYLDLYLIHWPVCLKPTGMKYPIDKDDLLPMDLKSVWEEMEECQRLGLVKSIGVSNFSCKKLEQLLAMATIPPSVNQVEMHPVWQQKKLIDFCKGRGIHVSAYSPLGGNQTPWGTNQVIECSVLKEIAAAKGKSLAQISLRWIYQQGASVIVKSFKQERMKENIDIFDWELSVEDSNKISQIQQCKGNPGHEFVSANGPYKSVHEFWDGEI